MGKTCLNLSVMKISIFFQSYQDFNQFLKEISLSYTTFSSEKQI